MSLPSPDVPVLLCEVHPGEAVTHYCGGKDCQRGICKECLSIHKDHQVLSMQELAKANAAELETKQRFLHERYTRLRAHQDRTQELLTDGIATDARHTQQLASLSQELESAYTALRRCIVTEQEAAKVAQAELVKDVTQLKDALSKDANATLELESGVQQKVALALALDRGAREIIAQSKELHQEEDKQTTSSDAGIDQALNAIKARMDRQTSIDRWLVAIQQLAAASADTRIMGGKPMTAATSLAELKAEMASLDQKASTLLAEVAKQTQGLAETVAKCKAQKEELQAFIEQCKVMGKLVPAGSQSQPLGQDLSSPHVHYLSADGLFLNIIYTSKMKKEVISLPNQPPCKYFDSIDIGSRIFVVGGYSQKKFISSGYMFLLESRELFPLPDMPFAKGFHTLASVTQTSFYCLGGFVYPPEKWLKTTEKYLISENEWRIGPPLNEVKDNLTACTSRGRYLYVFGGWNGNYVNTVEMLDTHKETAGWKRVKMKTSLWSPRHSMGAIEVMPDRILVFGGHPNHKDSYIFITQSNSVKLMVCQLPHEAIFGQRKPLFHKGKIYIVDNNAKKEADALHVYSAEEIQWTMQMTDKLQPYILL